MKGRRKMKMKRVISAIAAFAGIVGILPAAYASDLATNINDAEYLCFDLTSYANCVGFANSYEIEDGVIKDGVEFKVPNYIGVGQTETPLDFIYNKAAMDKKKETDGFVYDTEGTPYLISTELQSPNFPILGSAAYINNRTFTLDAGGKKLYELTFLADASFDLYAANFTLSVEYTDGTVKTDDDWVVKGIQANVSVITAHEGVESYVPFEVTPATEVNPDAAKETALKYKTNNPAEPWGVNQYIPAYKLELDPEKSVKNITFTNTAGSIVLAVFGVTAKCVTRLEEKLDSYAARIDELTAEEIKTAYELLRAGVAAGETEWSKYQAILEKKALTGAVTINAASIDENNQFSAVINIADMNNSHSYCLMLAVYDGNKLVEAHKVHEGIDESISAAGVPVSKTIASDLTGKNVKCFAWDALGAMEPVAEPVLK